MNRNNPLEPPQYKEYRGLFHMRCSKCGQTRTFGTSNLITHYRCPCGEVIELDNLRIAYMHCECKNHRRYRTNADTRLIEIDCGVCGYPVAMEYNSRTGRYQTINRA